MMLNEHKISVNYSENFQIPLHLHRIRIGFKNLWNGNQWKVEVPVIAILRELFQGCASSFQTFQAQTQPIEIRPQLQFQSKPRICVYDLEIHTV